MAGLIDDGLTIRAAIRMSPIRLCVKFEFMEQMSILCLFPRDSSVIAFCNGCMTCITVYDVRSKVSFSLMRKNISLINPEQKTNRILVFVFQHNSEFYLSGCFVSSNYSQILLGFLVTKINDIP